MNGPEHDLKLLLSFTLIQIMTTDLTKRYKVEEGLIKELTGSNHWSGKFYSKWVWSTYKIHDSFDTYKEAEALLKKLNKRSTGYTHYRITKKLFNNLILL